MKTLMKKTFNCPQQLTQILKVLCGRDCPALSVVSSQRGRPLVWKVELNLEAIRRLESC